MTLMPVWLIMRLLCPREGTKQFLFFIHFCFIIDDLDHMFNVYFESKSVLVKIEYFTILIFSMQEKKIRM